MVKVNVRANYELYAWQITSWKSHAPWIRVPKPHAPQLRSQISSCHCKHTCIIENANGVPIAPWYRSFPIPKWQDKQTMSISAIILLLWHSFYWWCFIECSLWYAVNFHHEWCMAWVGGLGIFLAHIKTPWTYKFPFYFTPPGIHKQKNMISTK
jgi:hypothetical protein